jgi:hypothetical protein
VADVSSGLSITPPRERKKKVARLPTYLHNAQLGGSG